MPGSRARLAHSSRLYSGVKQPHSPHHPQVASSWITRTRTQTQGVRAEMRSGTDSLKPQAQSLPAELRALRRSQHVSHTLTCMQGGPTTNCTHSRTHIQGVREEVRAETDGLKAQIQSISAEVRALRHSQHVFIGSHA